MKATRPYIIDPMSDVKTRRKNFKENTCLRWVVGFYSSVGKPTDTTSIAVFKMQDPTTKDMYANYICMCDGGALAGLKVASASFLLFTYYLF